jgi:hypothetical protein
LRQLREAAVEKRCPDEPPKADESSKTGTKANAR